VKALEFNEDEWLRWALSAQRRIFDGRRPLGVAEYENFHREVLRSFRSGAVELPN